MARSRAFLNTLIVAGGYLASRLLGLGRDVIISAQFGTQPELDAFRASFGILDLIYLVVAGGALGSAFIPIFSELLQRGDAERAWRLANSILTLALGALAVACGAIALFAEPIVALTVGRGFTPELQQRTAEILRLMLIQPVLLGIGGLAKATLESFERFTLPALGANLYNLGIIGGALLAPLGGIDALVWGVNAGAALFLLVQLPGLRRVGARPLLQAPLALPEAWRVLTLLAPRLFGQSAWQINLIAIASFASTLGSGAVSANAYALQLMVLPHGLIALSIGTVIFPQLARLHAAGETAALRAAVLQAVRGVLFLALPAAAILGLLALPIVRALLQRGAFDTASAALTAEALGGYAVGLAAYAVAEILVRAFYAMQDTRTPVVVACGAIALNIALAAELLRRGMGIGGLGLAFSIANICEAAVLLALLRGRLAGFGGAFWRALGAMAAAAAACGLTIAALQGAAGALHFLRAGDSYSWPGDFVPLLAWLTASGALGAAAYGACAALFRLDEITTIAARLRRRPHDSVSAP
jgi:putative peptidoglycan lipid II flippase